MVDSVSALHQRALAIDSDAALDQSWAPTQDRTLLRRMPSRYVGRRNPLRQNS
jgi:hypothetical protein